MSRLPIRRTTASIALVALTASMLLAAPSGAQGTLRTSGKGSSLYVGWTEYDPEDLLGLPGNVHIGFLWADAGPYGQYVNGNITDFDCDEGEIPYGGGHFVEDVAETATDVVETATENAVESQADSGAVAIDAAQVTDAIQTELSQELPDFVAEAFEEVPACDYIQDRFLNGDGTTTVGVDVRNAVATITGNLTVSNGGHGEPGTVLGNPPINLTITGGEWNRYQSSYKSTSATFKYSYSHRGTSYGGGVVTGSIGAMGFADDADDVSYGGFDGYSFRTTERFR